MGAYVDESAKMRVKFSWIGKGFGGHEIKLKINETYIVRVQTKAFIPD